MWEDIEIKVEKMPADKRKAKPDNGNLGFGNHFTDHMFQMKWNREQGWHDAVICPFRDITLSPAALVFHYGQEIFEGMKAYKNESGQLYFFRPDRNLERMNKSAMRMCMPRFPSELVLKAMKALVYLDREWVPSVGGSSLYMRPTMIATDPTLGVHVSDSYLFYVILTPVGAYYAEGFGPTKIYVSEEYIRAAQGGVGEAKAGGNYAGTLLMGQIAQEKGYSQVLWLDAKEHKYIEEVGTSNIFFKFKDQLITPALSGSILHGVTRQSVIEMAQSWKVEVVERKISIDEIIESIENGTLEEAFATGTAAVISPIGELYYKENAYTVADGNTGKFAQQLFDDLTAIQTGVKEDPFNWVVRVG